MNRGRERSRFVLALGACLAGTVAANAQAPQAQIPGPNVKPTVPPIVKECPDLAAVGLTSVVLLVNPDNKFEGRIRITGVIRNFGKSPR